MKVIIAGSRDYSPTDAEINAAIAEVEIGVGMVTEVVSGGASGVDDRGERWAHARGIPVRRFPADWKKYGKSAGPRRNREMADYAEAAVVFIRNRSRGSTNMADTMRAQRKKTVVVEVA